MPRENDLIQRILRIRQTDLLSSYNFRGIKEIERCGYTGNLICDKAGDLPRVDIFYLLVFFIECGGQIYGFCE